MEMQRIRGKNDGSSRRTEDQYERIGADDADRRADDDYERFGKDTHESKHDEDDGHQPTRTHVEPSAEDTWHDDEKAVGLREAGSGTGHSKNKKYISVLSAFMIMTTWSTSSSNVLYPYTFGVLGVVGGPLLMLVAFFIQWKATRWTVQAARATHAETFGALGEALVWLFHFFIVMMMKYMMALTRISFLPFEYVVLPTSAWTHGQSLI